MREKKFKTKLYVVGGENKCRTNKKIQSNLKKKLFIIKTIGTQWMGHPIFLIFSNKITIFNTNYSTLIVSFDSYVIRINSIPHHLCMLSWRFFCIFVVVG